MEYTKLEALKNDKKNIYETYHLQVHEGFLPTIGWESSLRSRKPKKAKKEGEENQDGTEAKKGLPGATNKKGKSAK
jgi:hypothetical protein